MSLYLDLMKLVLTGMIYEDLPAYQPWMPAGMPYDAQVRAQGNDWPSQAHTMVGLERLENVRQCAESVLMEGIPGDLADCGTWRGGCAIFMRAILAEYGDLGRKVWVADSFQGLLARPPGHEILAVPQEEVQRNFRLYGLLDDQVQFIPGWFHESLPGAPVGKLSVLRLDGDHYVAQMPALENLYPRLSEGGYVIIDDYPGIPETKQAVEDYRAREGITTPIRQAGAAGWWRKS